MGYYNMAVPRNGKSLYTHTYKIVVIGKNYTRVSKV